jgi:tetratricopeptide (TPR) repeat protein
MPQVFSGGWLFLFIIVMAICIIRIWIKIGTIQNEAPMNRPVIKVTPIPPSEAKPDSKSGVSSLLVAADDLIKRGEYKEALGRLEALLENLSPTEDREMRGMVLFRIAACHCRLAVGGERFQYLLRAGEALREAVRLFAPVRYRDHYLRALDELAGLYDDLARGRNPVENFNQAARTCETAAAAARESELFFPQAVFLARSGSAYRQLARHGEPQVNLRKAVEAYEKALCVLEEPQDENAALKSMKILKVLGDTYADLAKYFQKTESLIHAVNAYESALGTMDEERFTLERSTVLMALSRTLLELYDDEKSPAHLRQALRCSRNAMDAAKGSDNLILKGMSMAVMGDALIRYADSKDRRENLKRAVKLYETALGIIKDGEEPALREKIRESLAETVQKISSMGEGAHGAKEERT